MKRLVVVLGAAVLGVLLAPAGSASAHPLGNFSVNQLAALDLYPDRIEVAAAVDTAELPTLQEKSTVDRVGAASYAASSCAALARELSVSVDSRRLQWTVGASAFEYVPGSAGLMTSRLACRLTAPARLDAPATVSVANGYRADRIGWRELTAAGHGVRLVGSPLPTQSVSGGLSAYPEDLLSAPLDVRAAKLRVEPGPADGAVVAAPVVRGSVGLTRWTAAAEDTLRRMVGGRLTPLVGVLAVLLAVVLGAAHAALPGHGKTVMAAYLAGRAGRPRDAVAVGATVTLTHTGGVLVLGLMLTTVAGLVGETVLGWLGVVSGGLVAVVGLGMLLGARRRAGGWLGGHTHAHGGHGGHGGDGGHGHGAHGLAHDGHDHAHDGHDHVHHGHDHGRAHDGHAHDGHAHDGHAQGGHARGNGPDRPSRLGIVGIGLAGGLVPSPSALIVLLGAIGLGRTGFGVLLVLGYGIGMAGTLTAAGLLLIRLRDRWSRRRWRLPRFAARLPRFAPSATAGLVLLVGLGLAGRALAGLV